MDEAVLRAMARWPDVPDVFGWLALDRRGQWRIATRAGGGFERIANAALRGFIDRNYCSDARGRWYFQNGPQRVFVSLAYTPLVARLEDGSLRDHCGRAFGTPSGLWLDEEGSLLIAAEGSVALLDDRDLACFVERLPAPPERLPRIGRSAVAERFGFVPEPRP
jgi:hypothetical protein